MRTWDLEAMAGQAVGDGNELRGRIVELEREIRELMERGNARLRI